VGQLWEILIGGLRRRRIRIGDACWAAVQPALSKPQAGYWRVTHWRRRRGADLRCAAASLRASWQGASGRRRATLGVLAVLPFAMASGATAILLPLDGDPRAGPAQVRTAADAPFKPDVASAATARPRATRYERTAQATSGADAATAAEGVVVAPDPAAASQGSGLAGGSRAGDGGGGRGGGGGDSSDSPAHGDDRSDRVERRTTAAPAPRIRTYTRRGPAGGGDERFRLSPGPPAVKLSAPKAQVPGAPPAPAAPPDPPVTETAPQVTPPEADLGEDSDSDEDGGPGESDPRGPPPDRGGGSDKGEDP
jgi:hypothetical protein